MNSDEPDFPDLDKQSLPVNLHFPDQRVLAVDIDAAMRKGLRMRRNKKVLTGSVAAATAVVLGVSAAYLAPSSSASYPPSAAASSLPAPHATSSNTAAAIVPAQSAFERSDVVRRHPPVGGHVTLIGTRANAMAGFTMAAVAWQWNGQLGCGFADLNSSTNNSIAWIEQPDALSTTPTVLAPRLTYSVTDAEGYELVIGFASGDVAKVSMEYQDERYDANVVPVSGTPSIGAYMIWISPAHGGAKPNDTPQMTGYDSRGDIVAR